MANFARLLLTGGPLDGTEVATLPPDLTAPVQIVWSAWTPQGFTAWLYEWHGETTTTGSFVEALIYRTTGRRLLPDEIPPAMAELTEMWADGVDLLMRGLDLPREALWPGL